jgi:aminoglycoside 6'-N-acetyltransferase I
LWPHPAESEHVAEITEFLEGRAREPLAVLVAADGADQLMGFAELSIRAYAEGCRTDRVAYLEGWYVAPDVRNRGVGGALIAAAEAWARSQGCVELASDAELTNEASAAAHRALGFVEVGRVRCFRKDL